MSDLRAWWPIEGGDEIRDELEAAYADPARGYHDTQHLAEVFAAWFHDAVYDGRPDAEERSAQWALSALAGRPDVDEVARLVRLTERHLPAPDDVNGCALSDADLAILAAAPERYTEYVATVRREYAHVSDPDFAAGRSAILADLLDKPTLFHTAYARDRWEAAARANVGAEVSAMRPRRP
jgi:predicted metal-dependent HD superfamily phosphohydrolase